MIINKMICRACLSSLQAQPADILEELKRGSSCPLRSAHGSLVLSVSQKLCHLLGMHSIRRRMCALHPAVACVLELPGVGNDVKLSDFGFRLAAQALPVHKRTTQHTYELCMAAFPNVSAPAPTF